MGGRVLVAIRISGDNPPRPVANRSVRITPRVLTDIQRWLANSPVPPPFRVLDRFAFNKPALQPFHLPMIKETARRMVLELSNDFNIDVGHVMFSRVGMDLFGICKPAPSEDFFELMLERWMQNDYSVWSPVDGGPQTHSRPT